MRRVAKRKSVGREHQVAALAFAFALAHLVIGVSLLGPNAIARLAERVLDQRVEAQFGQGVETIDGLLQVVGTRAVQQGRDDDVDEISRGPKGHGIFRQTEIVEKAKVTAA